MYKTIDLFAGAGGLSLGFKQTGKYRLLAAAEIQDSARDTYKKNIPDDPDSFVFIDNVVGYDFKKLNFAAEQKEHTDTASKLWPIREEYISLMTDFEELPDQTIVSRRDDLMGKTAKIYETSPQTDEKAYVAAQDALKNKQEQFFTQEELNVMLPMHLRRTPAKETTE